MPINAGAAGFKSVSRGQITIAASTNSQTATIPAVNTAKTEVRYLGNSGNGGTSNYDMACVELTNSTTLTATRQASTTGASVILKYELTEWN